MLRVLGSLKTQNSLVSCQTIFCWIDWVSGCLTHHIRLMLLPFPLRPAERSILFSEKSVRLFDNARSAASSHAPKKGCAVREVRAANLHIGVAFLCLLSLAKQRKCPVGMRRMVKTTQMLTTKHQSFSGCLKCQPQSTPKHDIQHTF